MSEIHAEIAAESVPEMDEMYITWMNERDEHDEQENEYDSESDTNKEAD